jgi:hypothetical protein
MPCSTCPIIDLPSEEAPLTEASAGNFPFSRNKFWDTS